MIDHIGMLTLKTGADPAPIAEGLRALVGQVPGLLRAQVRTDLGLKDDNASLLFQMSFESEQAWRDYGTHPAHLAVIKERIAPVLESKAFVQARHDNAVEGFDGRLSFGSRPALVLVDPAVAYNDPTCPLYAGVEPAFDAMRTLLAEARAHGAPVFVTRVAHDPTGTNGGIFRRKVPSLQWLAADSPYSTYVDGLAPQASDVEVPKQYPSAFAHTSLAPALTARGIDTVIIAGVSTSGCIRATATDAMQYGFVPVVVRDAVGDRLAEVHEVNLADIQAKVGEVVSLAEVTEYLKKVGA